MLWSNMLGSDILGSKVLGSKVLGSKVLGSKNAPSSRVDRHRHRLRGHRCKEILQYRSVLVRKPEQPPHQFEKARLLPDIQQLEEFRAGVPFQSREKPFGFVNRCALAAAFKIINYRSHLCLNALS